MFRWAETFRRRERPAARRRAAAARRARSLLTDRPRQFRRRFLYYITRLTGGRFDQLDRLAVLAGATQHHVVSFAVDAERFSVELTSQVKRFSGDAVASQLQGIGGDSFFERLEDFCGGAEEAVGRDQSVDALMRTLQVVVVNEEPDPLPGVGQVEKDARLDALPPQRAPETLDLTQGLRTAGLGHDLLDAPFL